MYGLELVGDCYTYKVGVIYLFKFYLEYFRRVHRELSVSIITLVGLMLDLQNLVQD